MVQLHNIKSSKIKSKPRIGRGGKRGKTSGRGTKGQKARAGHRIRPEIRDFISRIPKLRGYGRNRAKSVIGSKQKPMPVSLSSLEDKFNDGEIVTKESLFEKGLLKKKSGKILEPKILANGDISKKLIVKGVKISEKAKEMIQKADGEVQQ